MITVSTNEELALEIKKGADEITVTGELANKIHAGKKITKLGVDTLAGITAAIAIFIATGGGAALGLEVMAPPIAAMTGLEVALILSILFCGIALLTAIWRDYDEIEYTEGKILLRRKK